MKDEVFGEVGFVHAKILSFTKLNIISSLSARLEIVLTISS